MSKRKYEFKSYDYSFLKPKIVWCSSLHDTYSKTVGSDIITTSYTNSPTIYINPPIEKIFWPDPIITYVDYEIDNVSSVTIKNNKNINNSLPYRRENFNSRNTVKNKSKKNFFARCNFFKSIVRKK